MLFFYFFYSLSLYLFFRFIKTVLSSSGLFTPVISPSSFTSHYFTDSLLHHLHLSLPHLSLSTSPLTASPVSSYFTCMSLPPLSSSISPVTVSPVLSYFTCMSLSHLSFSISLVSVSYFTCHYLTCLFLLHLSNQLSCSSSRITTLCFVSPVTIHFGYLTTTIIIVFNFLYIINIVIVFIIYAAN